MADYDHWAMVTNQIFLEPDVLDLLKEFADAWWEYREQLSGNGHDESPLDPS